jgi:hypothetical protein
MSAARERSCPTSGVNDSAAIAFGVEGQVKGGRLVGSERSGVRTYRWMELHSSSTLGTREMSSPSRYRPVRPTLPPFLTWGNIVSNDEETEPPVMLTAAQARGMFGTAIFGQLTQPMRAWAIVGCYIGHFALLETAIANSLSILLGLDSLAGAIIARNMGMIEKVRAVRTIVNIAVHLPAERQRLNDLLKRAQAAAEERNVIAHVPFGDSQTSDGVRFYTVDAKGTFRASSLDWSIATSDMKIDELRQVENGLSSVESKAAFEDARRAIKGERRTLEEWLSELGLGAFTTSGLREE